MIWEKQQRSTENGLIIDRLGEIEEVRYYYRDALHGEVDFVFPEWEKTSRRLFQTKPTRQRISRVVRNRKLKVEGNYTKNAPSGEWNYYYVDGRLKMVEEAKGPDNYVWEFYLPDSLHTQT